MLQSNVQTKVKQSLTLTAHHKTNVSKALKSTVPVSHHATQNVNRIFQRTFNQLQNSLASLFNYDTKIHTNKTKCKFNL